MSDADNKPNHSTNPENANSDAAGAAQPYFGIEKIYIKDLSIENPNAPESFLQQEQPQVEIQLQTRAAPVGENIYESVLVLTVTAKITDKTLFLVEVAQAGIFQIRNLSEADIHPILGVHCPTILFPYAREAVSDAVSKAGYPPVYLAPVNFEALYHQQLQQQAAATNGAGTDSTAALH